MNDSERLDKVEQEQDKLWKTVNQIDKKLEINSYQTHQILNIVQKLQETVDELRQKPAQNWDKIVGAIITGIVGVLVGLLFSKFQ